MLTEHKCKACGEMHGLKYFLFAGGQRHLFYKCPKTKQTFYLPRVEGLPIPEVKSRKLQKLDNESKTGELF